MRDIKFRAWDKKQKYMAVQGDPDLETIQSFMFHFGKCELMQYIGLKDKNDKEIYEGDIVVFYDMKDEPIQIKFDKGSFGWFVYEEKPYSDFISIQRLRGDDIKMLEIVGNIYETPELLDTKG